MNDIYVASSWRSESHKEVVRELRVAGFSVYDFKHPEGDDDGFNWFDVDPNWQSWTVPEYIAGLLHPLASDGFARDMEALASSRAAVMVMPCSRSAHLEFGYAIGKGKVGVIYMPPGCDSEPELMYKMSSRVVSRIRGKDSIIETLKYEFALKGISG